MILLERVVTMQAEKGGTQKESKFFLSSTSSEDKADVSSTIQILEMLLSDQCPVQDFDELLSQFDKESHNIVSSPLYQRGNNQDDGTSDNCSELNFDLSLFAKSVKHASSNLTEEEKNAIRLKNAETAKLWRQKKRQNNANNEDLLGRLQFENKRMELLLSELDTAVNYSKEILVNHFSRKPQSRLKN